MAVFCAQIGRTKKKILHHRFKHLNNALLKHSANTLNIKTVYFRSNTDRPLQKKEVETEGAVEMISLFLKFHFPVSGQKIIF